MACVKFTPNLRRHLDCSSAEVNAGTVAEALESVFAENPRMRGYVVDDQGALRKHMLIFLDGLAVEDREKLSDVIKPDSELFVLQALSGG